MEMEVPEIEKKQYFKAKGWSQDLLKARTKQFLIGLFIILFLLGVYFTSSDSVWQGVTVMVLSGIGIIVLWVYG